MVSRPNLGCDSIFFSTSIHSTEAYSPYYAHNGNSIRDKEFDSNVFHLLILTKAFLILFCTHFHLVLLSLSPHLVMSRKMSTLHSGQSLLEFIPPAHNLDDVDPGTLKLSSKEEVVEAELRKGMSGNAKLSHWVGSFSKASVVAHRAAFVTFWLCKFIFGSHPHYDMKHLYFWLAIKISARVSLPLAPMFLGHLYF